MSILKYLQLAYNSLANYTSTAKIKPVIVIDPLTGEPITVGGGGGTGGDFTYSTALSQDKIKSDTSFGGVQATVTTVNNKLASALFDVMFFPLVAPTYNQPSGSLATNLTGLREVGENNSLTLVASFIVNDSGGLAVNPYNFNGSGPQASNLISIPGYITLLGTQSQSVTMSYLDGPIKNDSHGNPDPTGQILAGTITRTTNITGIWAYWLNIDNTGAVVTPIDTATLRAMSGKVVANVPASMTFVVGGDSNNDKVVIAIPGDKLINTAILNGATPVGASFIKTSFIVNDLTNSGQTSLYSVFTHDTGTGYSSPATYVLTFKNS